MSRHLPCVLCGRPSLLAVLCRACLARRCGCGHAAGDHVGGGRCLHIPACACLELAAGTAPTSPGGQLPEGST